MGPEVVAFLGVGCYLVALALYFLPTRCPHPCTPCQEEKDRKVAREAFDRHQWEHRWWGIRGDDCDTCRKMKRDE